MINWPFVRNNNYHVEDIIPGPTGPVGGYVSYGGFSNTVHASVNSIPMVVCANSSLFYPSTNNHVNSGGVKSGSGISIQGPWPYHLAIGDLVTIDLTNGQLHLKKMVSMDEISEKFWGVMCNDYKDYLEWKKKTLSII